MAIGVIANDMVGDIVRGMAKLSDNAAGASAAEAGAADPMAAVVARARRLMLISVATTAIATAAVIGVIGYRLLNAASSGDGAIADGIVMLPKGARVVSTTVSDGRIVVTLDIGGSSEVRIFDLKTLRQTGRLRFGTEQ